MKKPAFIVPARNKERNVRRLVESVLAQTIPCEVLLSDQGSTDYTRTILESIVSDYEGHHTVRLLDCPKTQYRGMVGMNEHINWIMEQTDAEHYLLTSADDLTDPQRAEKTMRVFAEFNPSMVLTGMYSCNDRLECEGVNAMPNVSGFVSVERMIPQAVGGSTTQAWTRDFWQKIGPLAGVPGLDVVMPFLACCDRGAYYLHEFLHTYIKYADPDNTGLEGAWRAGDDGEKLRLEELMHFQVCTAYYTILSIMHKNGWENEAAKAAVFEGILDRAASWVGIRQHLSINGIQPKAFRI